MSLVPDYESSSNSDSLSSDSEIDSENENASAKKDQIKSYSKCKLPAPNFGEVKDSTRDTKSSVFKNPFIEAEDAKAAILQKHVKMVETKDNIVVINGKKICWNYRKGRCRFGHNCKFAHDSDIQKSKDQIETEKLAALQKSVVCENGQTGFRAQIIQGTGTDSEQIDEDCLSQDNKKRKRPGLSQGLIPGKKVMKHYLKNQKTSSIRIQQPKFNNCK